MMIRLQRKRKNSILCWIVCVLILGAGNCLNALTVEKISNKGLVNNAAYNDIMSLLEPYIQQGTEQQVMDNEENQVMLMKLRKYVRGASAEKIIVDGAKSPNKTKSRRRLEVLTVEQCKSILAYLQSEFSEDTIRLILKSQPRILRRDVKNQVSPTIQFLKDLYRDEKVVEDAIRNNPTLLFVRGLGYHSRNNDANKIECFLTDRLKVSVKEMKVLKDTKPFLFQSSLQNIQEVCCFVADVIECQRLTFHKSSKLIFDSSNYMSATVKALRKTIVSHPSLFSCNVQTNLLPTLLYLKEHFHLNPRAISSLVKSCPGLLGLSVERNLAPKLQFFKEEILLDTPAEFSQCMCRHPQILGLSLVSHL